MLARRIVGDVDMQRNAAVGEGEGKSARDVVVVQGRQAARAVICDERGPRQALDTSSSRSAVPLHTHKVSRKRDAQRLATRVLVRWDFGARLWSIRGDGGAVYEVSARGGGWLCGVQDVYVPFLLFKRSDRTRTGP